MALAHRTRRRLYTWVIATLVGGAIAVTYSLFMGGQPKFAFVIGCTIGGGVIGFELFFVQEPIGAWLRRLPLFAFVSVSTLLWTVIIVASLQLIPLLFGVGEAYGEKYRTIFQLDVVFSLALAFAMNAALRIGSLIGGRVLMNFLVGRYHRPVREKRVFMFLDIADSTRLSEELGDARVQLLIGRFFFDIAGPIAENGGETHRYIGDEIVVTWPFSVATQDARCVKCVFDIQHLIATHSARYKADFDLVPQFRVGMHGGSVIASEVGDNKREIVYFGDTVNTAARLQSLCKEKQKDFLVSGDFLAALTLPPEAKVQCMGEVELRGKAKSLKVYALSCGSRSIDGAGVSAAKHSEGPS